MLTFAMRNTLMVAGLAVLIGRSIGVPLGMISGYIGGRVDRVLSSIVDSFIVIPVLPLLILIASLLRGQMTLSESGASDRSPRLGFPFQALSRPDSQPARARVHEYGGFLRHEHLENRSTGAPALRDPLSIGRCGQRFSVCHWLRGHAVGAGLERDEHADALGR